MDEKRLNEEEIRGLWEEDGDLGRISEFYSYLSEQSQPYKARIKEKAQQRIAGSSQTTEDSLLSGRPTPWQAGSEGFKKLFRPRRRMLWMTGIAASLVLVAALGVVGIPLLNQMMGPKYNPPSPMAERPAGAGGSSYNGSMMVDAGSVADTASKLTLESARSYEYDAVMPAPPGAPEPEESAPLGESMGKKIIYTADATLKVSDVTLARNQIEAKAKAINGYLVNASQDNSSSSSYAYMTVKIPSAKFEEFKDSLSEFGTVQNLNQYSQDIGLQYYDAAARLKNFRAQEQRYLDIMKGTKTIEEILQVESYLNMVRRNIESLQGQLQYWDNQVDYSQISITLYPIQTNITVTDPWAPVSFQSTLVGVRNAVIKTVSTAWNLLNKMLILIGYAFPVLVLFTVVWLLRRRRKPKAPRDQIQK